MSHSSNWWTINRATGFVDADVEPGELIRWNSWNERAAHVPGVNQPFTLIEHAQGSDYSGNLIERSNYRILEGLDTEEVLVRVSGGYGTFGLGFLGDPNDLPEELQEAIASLEAYRILDESDWSELHMETENEQWTSHGAHDFRRELQKVFPDLEEHLDDIADGNLGDLYHQLCEHYHCGEASRNEQGDSIYFFTEDMATQCIDDVDIFVPWFLKERGFIDAKSPDGAVLADAIHDWFTPFADGSFSLAA